MVTGRDVDPQVASHARHVLDRGWTVLEGAVKPDLVAELRTTVRRLERDLGVPTSNPGIEGKVTRRIYNLLARDPVFRLMPTHPTVLPVVESLLDEHCLLSGMTTIDIGPGEVSQTFHSDDMAFDAVVPRPHGPLSVTCIWALTDFTVANGATRVVPGSHRFAAGPRDEDRPTDVEVHDLEVRAGDVVVFHGSLWHGGGANSTASEWRLGGWVQYCHGCLRQQQNVYVGVPVDLVRTFDERLLELSGYRLYRGIMGHVEGRSPDEHAFGLLGSADDETCAGGSVPSGAKGCRVYRTLPVAIDEG